LASRVHFTLTFDSYTPEEIEGSARHIAGKEKRLRGCVRCQRIPGRRWMSRATDGHPRKVVIACKREGARDCT
jgi:hypothetical protein